MVERIFFVFGIYGFMHHRSMFSEYERFTGPPTLIIAIFSKIIITVFFKSQQLMEVVPLNKTASPVFSEIGGRPAGAQTPWVGGSPDRHKGVVWACIDAVM
jgi:hypothetical protein